MIKLVFVLFSFFMFMMYVLRKAVAATFGVSNVVFQAIIFINTNLAFM